MAVEWDSVRVEPKASIKAKEHTRIVDDQHREEGTAKSEEESARSV